jgi:hypothetical protein
MGGPWIGSQSDENSMLLQNVAQIVTSFAHIQGLLQIQIEIAGIFIIIIPIRS